MTGPELVSFSWKLWADDMPRSRLEPSALRALNALLAQALELSPDARQAWLAKLTDVDPELQGRLQNLLERVEEASDALTQALPLLNTGVRGPTPSADRAWGPGVEVGPYRLVSLLGQGGMGAVWRAERTDGIMERPVALKLPHAWVRSPELFERMAREREILASLSHPNIARLYDAGITSDGQPYLALELIVGIPIHRFAQARGLGVRARLELFLAVAKAVGYAHGQLVVHRDVKPTNILVSEDGQPHLLDFGVAKLLEDRAQPDITGGQRPPFTPAYASPEQIRGETLSVATDVYSLGAVLYELLSGQRPHPSTDEGRAGLERAVLYDEPVAPSRKVSDEAVRSALRGDLDAIVLKSLRKAPSERYATVDAFAEDLRRHLSGRTVRAQPDSASYRLRKFILRNRAPVLVSALILLLILGGAGAAIWLASKARAEQRRAEEVKDFIASVLRNADPYRAESGIVSAKGLLHQAEARLEDRFLDRPQLRAELQELIGAGLGTLEDYKGSRAVLSIGYTEATSQLGENHPRTLALRVALAAIRRRMADLEGLAEELAAIRTALDGADTPASVRGGLLMTEAHLALNEGRYAEAAEKARAADAWSQRTLGADTLETVETSNMVAVALQFGGAPPQEALAAAEHAYARARRVLHDRPRHPVYLDARATYARSLLALGRFTEGEAILRGVVEDAVALFGPSCEMAGYFSVHLAEATGALGRFDEALSHANTNVRILASLTGTTSHGYGSALAYRGRTHLEARREQEALRDLEQGISILDPILGLSHAKLQAAYAHRALVLARLGDSKTSIKLIETLDAQTGPKPAALHRFTGAALRRSGRLSEAEARLQTALETAANDARPDWERMLGLAELGLVYLDQAMFDQAEPRLRDALKLFERLPEKMTPEWAETLSGLGRVELERGRVEKALAKLKEADGFWQRFAPRHRDAGKAALWLALAQEASDQGAQARLTRKRAKTVASGTPGTP